MRMLKKAAIATVAAGSLSILGAAPALAADKPDIQINKSLNQTQTCTYQALIPVNLALINLNPVQGSFSCGQSGKVS